MHKYDALIIIAESLPSRQAYDLMRWYCTQETACLLHPSVQWWINQHASEVSVYHNQLRS